MKNQKRELIALMAGALIILSTWWLPAIARLNYSQPSVEFVPPEKPNFLLIMADDMDYELQGFMGNSIIQTPNIDSIAQSGIVFPNGLSSMSVCRPALASILSGKFPHENFVVHNYTNTDQLINGRLGLDFSLPDILKQAGYYTFIGGKFWEGDPADYGFTHVSTLGTNFVRTSQNDLFDFIDQAHSENKPFFVWYAPALPHVPHNPPQEFLDLYSTQNIPVPEWIEPEDVAEFREAEKKFYATISWFDAKIGEVLQRLQQTNELDNTIIIYMIDNGWANGYLAKASPYEKGLRSTIIVKIPNNFEKQFLSHQASIVDIPKTILDYAQIPSPSVYSGQSLKPIIENSSVELRDNLTEGVYGAVPVDGTILDAIYGVVSKDETKKYILFLKEINVTSSSSPTFYHNFVTVPIIPAFTEQFFDLSIDPHEQNNLINNPEYQNTIQTLRQSSSLFLNQIYPMPTVMPNPNFLSCKFNKVYSNTQECICQPSSSEKVSRWSVFEDSELSCTTDGVAKFICRETTLDLETQKAVIPQEIIIRAKENISLEQIKQFLGNYKIKILKQPCEWKKASKFNNLIIETIAGKEQTIVESIMGSGLVIETYQNPLWVCATH